MKVKVSVDKKVCIGSGTCIVLASEHFELNEEGKAEIKKSANDRETKSELVLDVKKRDREKLLAAARACPTQAIQLVDEKGEKIYP